MAHPDIKTVEPQVNTDGNAWIGFCPHHNLLSKFTFFQFVQRKAMFGLVERCNMILTRLKHTDSLYSLYMNTIKAKKCRLLY